MNFIRVLPLHFCWTHIGTLTQLFKNIIFIYLWLSVFMIFFFWGFSASRFMTHFLGICCWVWVFCERSICFLIARHAHHWITMVNMNISLCETFYRSYLGSLWPHRLCTLSHAWSATFLIFFPFVQSLYTHCLNTDWYRSHSSEVSSRLFCSCHDILIKHLLAIRLRKSRVISIETALFP